MMASLSFGRPPLRDDAHHGRDGSPPRFYLLLVQTHLKEALEMMPLIPSGAAAAAAAAADDDDDPCPPPDDCLLPRHAWQKK